ncbi:unnamed protein product [Cyclocybe aegerita]|uniref:DUF6534 domain-containing protein n=1 Tax=Cyclocybe aegerita TaxID=1973307 RepID=A0A8S0XIT6_CYCAE|nr:unnamed protein product [Cyclocybe aegerita]
MSSSTPHRHASDRELGAPFIGYAVGAVLFGITVLQVYQYFTNYAKDSRLRKCFITLVCILDLSSMIIGTKMLYTIMITYGSESSSVGENDRVVRSAWSFSFYMYQIWSVPESLFESDIRAPGEGHSSMHDCLRDRYVVDSSTEYNRRVELSFDIFGLIGAGTVFLTNVEQVHSVHTFTPAQMNVFYFTLSTTAFIDTTLGTTMASVLYHGRPENRRLLDIVKFLVVFFVGTGLLTGIAHVIILALYTILPEALLYMSVQLSVTRLYANSILALFNAKKGLNEKLEDPTDLDLPASALLFGENGGGPPSSSTE